MIVFRPKENKRIRNIYFIRSVSLTLVAVSESCSDKQILIICGGASTRSKSESIAEPSPNCYQNRKAGNYSLDEYLNELLMEAYRLYEEEIESRNPNDYEVYLPKMSKLMCTYSFLSRFASEHGGIVEDLNFDRRETSGGITAYFTLLDLTGEELTEFCGLIREAHALSIDALIDGTICLSMTFTGVFRKINDKDFGGIQ